MSNSIRDVFSNATCLYSRTEVESAFDRMAMDINHELSDAKPVFLCVVVGGIVAMGNLLPRLNFPLEVDYIHVTRYRNSTRGNDVEWKAKPHIDLKDRTVVVVDDILDGGITLQEIVRYCESQHVSRVYTAVLVDKNDARLEGGIVHADFTGLRVDNFYVFGYGMDYKGYLRNAPGIYKVAEKHS